MGKQKKAAVFMFIDALGWEIVKEHNFCADILTERFPVKTQLGYSSTAVPTILSGKKPQEHKHFSFYYYSPETSPFKVFRYLPMDWLPGCIFNRWRVRHGFSQLIKKFYGFSGYFELYNVPYGHLPYFDYCEKTDIFAPGGLSPVDNLNDAMISKKIPYLISDWRQSDNFNITQMQIALENRQIEFGFLYTAALDGFLHDNIGNREIIASKLDEYREIISRLIETGNKNYDSFDFTIISDHGMTPLNYTVDLQSQIKALKLKFGNDYVAVYDSTMARFWFFNNSARQQVMKILTSQPDAKVLSRNDKQEFGIDFTDNMFGEEILLFDPGVQISPCDMGRNALPGMHGYEPGDKDSLACLLSTTKPPIIPEWIGDFFSIMTS